MRACRSRSVPGWLPASTTDSLLRSLSLSLSLFVVEEEGYLYRTAATLTWSTPTNGPTCGTMGTPQQVRDYRECAPKAVSCTALYLFVCFFSSFFFSFFFVSFFLSFPLNSNGSRESTRGSDPGVSFIENFSSIKFRGSRARCLRSGVLSSSDNTMEYGFLYNNRYFHKLVYYSSLSLIGSIMKRGVKGARFLRSIRTRTLDRVN